MIEVLHRGGLPSAEDVSPASFFYGSEGPMARELGIFCDESDSDAMDDPFYLLSLILHDQI